MSAFRILVADDHAVFRRSVCGFLASRSEWEVCGEALDGQDAVEKAAGLRPDVVLLDVNMPRLDGLRAVPLIKQAAPETEILIVSQHDPEHFLSRALEAGAAGFISKSNVARELLPAIEVIVRRTARAFPDISAYAPARPSGPSGIDQPNSLDVPGLDPADFPPQGVGRALLAQAAAAPEQEVVLVADDNADMREYIRRLLSSHYRVHAAANGREALATARAVNPDLILADIMMPELDGFGLLAEVRNDPGLKAKPLILLSARAGEEARIDGIRAGADDYVTKPFSARELVARVSGALALAKLRAEAEQDLRASEEKYRSLAGNLEAMVRARTQQLEQQSERLREVSKRLMQTQDDERRRIARELHDSVGQTLSALGLNLALADQRLKEKDPEIDELMRDSEHLIQQLSQEIRTASYLLHPPLLDENGLVDALQSYVQGVAGRSGLGLKLNVNGDLGRLSRELELAAFRIIQEALTNVIRHSESKTAEIRVSREGGALSIEVQDQGKGIPPEKVDQIQSRNSGVGISGMRERAFQFGGSMNIESSGHGTKISVTLPASTSTSQFVIPSSRW